MESLLVLRETISANGSISLDNDNSKVVLGTTTFAFNTPTAFHAQDPEPWVADIKTIVHAWLSRNDDLADYIVSCEDLGVRNLKFAERADLRAWLEGKSDDSEYIQQDVTEPKKDDEQYTCIYAKEKMLLDHELVLRGSKQVNFSSAAKECHRLIMQEFRKNQRFSTDSASPSAPSKSSSSQKQRVKEPIILVSPSPSSIINMANVKDFLEKGTFVPQTKSTNTPVYGQITRESAALGKMRFFVVDSVDKFKPEYWDRVVAVFVTGQSWQLKSYKWQDPHHLFANVFGISINYRGDPIPSTLKNWNVTVEEIERTKRFRDHEVVERIWEKLESHMLARGWGKKK